MNKINKETLKELEELREKAIYALEQLSEKFDEIIENAQDYYDSRSERWQESEKADCYSTWLDDIDSKKDEILNLSSELEEVDFSEIEKPEY